MRNRLVHAYFEIDTDIGATRCDCDRHDCTPAGHPRVAFARPGLLGRIGQPEEVAELILWLLSDKASLVTGAHVNARGGGFQVVGVS